MATAPKKKSEKKLTKKADDVQSVVDKIEDVVQEDTPPVPLQAQEITESIPDEDGIRSSMSEPVYEEPILTQLIVERYVGEKEMGLYQGDGDAFFVGNHHYQGQFSEGMMHGYGNYYWDSGLTYEGTFARNKVTGSGIYTWKDGSSYEGDVLDGLRHGWGTFHSADNKLSYTGEWSCGKRNGKGRMMYDAEGLSYYEGDWVDNVRAGWGHRQYPSGNVYSGMWHKNIRHGRGCMRWLDREQMYMGNWNNGIQEGQGEHTWFLHRRPGSQYPLRNMYKGHFKVGLRQGFGTFYYANGARYEGNWENNLKSGMGKFVFKNGRIYEGMFEKDHIMEFPTFSMDGMSTPDITKIRTRTPLPADQASLQTNDSHNTYSPSFLLEVHHLLADLSVAEREEEATQVIFVIMRHMSRLRRIYGYYSQLGHTESKDNTFVMTRMQLWRFLKDCHLHHHETTLAAMDRVLAKERTDSEDELHNPFTKILMREFISHLVSLSHHIYAQKHTENSPLLQWCLSKLISDNLLPNACEVRGHFYTDTRHAEKVLGYIEPTYKIFRQMSLTQPKQPLEEVFKMRQFIFMLKDLKLINTDLTPKAIIDVLAQDDPKVTDTEGAINLELEMTFLEFFEALVGCAQVFVTDIVMKDPNTPCPSTTVTAEQSVYSVPGSQSRVPSQEGPEDEAEMEALALHHGVSETTSPPLRTISSKSREESVKFISNTMMNTVSETCNQANIHSRGNSGKKSVEVMAGEPKKSSVFTVVDVEGELRPVSSSIHGGRSEHSDNPDDYEQHSEADVDLPEEEDQVDEATRVFNFWTKQMEIFFERKFLPASVHNFRVLEMVEVAVQEEEDRAWQEVTRLEAVSEGSLLHFPIMEGFSHEDLAISEAESGPEP